MPQPGDLPEPGTLPPGSRLPFPRNAAFTGRQADLKALADGLLFPSAAPSAAPTAITQPAAVSGSGGIGKTQLAVEFCYRYGRFFHGVHWLQADQDLNAQIALCGQEMGLPGWPADNLPQQAAATLAAWERQPERLVALDNLVDPGVLAEWLPLAGPGEAADHLAPGEFDPTLGVQAHALGLLERARASSCCLSWPRG